MQRPCCQRGSPCQDPAGNRTTWRSPDHRKETQTAVVWSCFPFIRPGQNHLGRHSEKGKKTRQTEEEVGRQAWSSPSPRGQWRTGEFICGAQRHSRSRDRWWESDITIKQQQTKKLCTRGYAHAIGSRRKRGLHTRRASNRFLHGEIWYTYVTEWNKMALTLVPIKGKFSRRLHRNEDTDEDSEVDLCLRLIRSVDLTRMSDWLAFCPLRESNTIPTNYARSIGN